MTKKDTTKDLITGGASAGTAIIAASGTAASIVLAGVLAFIPTIFGLGVDRIRNRGERRAQRLLESMTEADPNPQGFVEGLRARLEADDPNLISALRSLLAASVDSLSDAAIEPMALIGRAHLRGECPAWVARGWLRILAELTEAEHVALQLLVRTGAARLAETEERIKRDGRPYHAQPVELQLHREPVWVEGHSSVIVMTYPTRDGHGAMQLGEDPELHCEGFADRLWELLLRNHLAAVYVDPHEERRREEQREKRQQAKQKPRSLLVPYEERREEIRFKPEAFAAIASAFAPRL